jgi:hypothetical protein
MKLESANSEGSCGGRLGLKRVQEHGAANGIDSGAKEETDTDRPLRERGTWLGGGGSTRGLTRTATERGGEGGWLRGPQGPRSSKGVHSEGIDSEVRRRACLAWVPQGIV